MPAIRDYRDLHVWQKAMDLVVECYRLTAFLPKSEIYGLSRQIQRAAVSVPANIAEGNGRVHRGEYVHHLSIANGSLLELETHLLIAQRLSFLEHQELLRAFDLTNEVGRMLAAMTKKLRTPQA